MVAKTLVSPFASGYVLNPEQGGTGFNGDEEIPQGEVLGGVGGELGLLRIVQGDGVTVDTSTPGQIIISASGGTQFFIESQSTEAPNDVTNVDALTADGVTANVDAAFVPKGDGAIIAAIPDGTAIGGDKRGSGAVDLQTGRAYSYSVASGQNSVVAGGYNNGATGQFSAVGGGTNNTAGAASSTIAGGSTSSASGIASTVGGGISNAATGHGATVPGGSGNFATGDYSIVTGLEGDSHSVTGANVHASGKFVTAGDAQRGDYVCRGITTDATPLDITTDQQAAGALNQIPVRNSSVVTFDALIQCSAANANTDAMSWRVSGTAGRFAAPGTTALVAPITKTVIATGSGAGAYDVDITAANGLITITVTGEAAKTLNWVAAVRTAESMQS